MLKCQIFPFVGVIKINKEFIFLILFLGILGTSFSGHRCVDYLDIIKYYWILKINQISSSLWPLTFFKS